MREREQASRLKAIRALRQIQQLIAEKQAVEASLALTSEQERLCDKQAVYSATADGWRAAVENGSPCDPTWRLWGAVMVEQEQAIELAEASSAQAQAEQEAALEAWATTLAMSQLAGDGYRAARRRLSMRLGAMALDDATDLFVSGGRSQ